MGDQNNTSLYFVFGLFLFSSLLFSMKVHAGTQEFLCHNERFLTDPFALYLKNGSLSLVKNRGEICAFKKEGNTFFPIKADLEKCQLKNLSRIDKLRVVVGLDLGQKVLEKGQGYIKLSLDNSFAEYGPKKITSFIFCRRM